jgi:hypothetical protein
MNGYYFLLIILLLLLSGCEQSTDPDPDPNTTFTGIYLDQEAPGSSPELFGPSSLHADDNWFWHGGMTFSPDLSEMYFGKILLNEMQFVIHYVRYIDGTWTSASRFPLGSLGEQSPVFSVTGDTMYFHLLGNVAAPVQMITRTNLGWSEPQPVNIEFPAGASFAGGLSVATNGNLYFAMWSNGSDDIFCAEMVDGSYQPAINLGSSFNTSAGDFSPFVGPADDYLIFGSDRSGGFGSFDLYISFKNADGTWGSPINMGSVINSSGEEWSPYVSPDGEYLFLVKNSNPYWMEAAIIDDLDPD